MSEKIQGIEEVLEKTRRATCGRCGGSWTPRVEQPRYCPLCGSAAWNIPYKRKEYQELSALRKQNQQKEPA